MRGSVWIGRLGRLAMGASLVGIAAAMIGATLARYDIVGKIAGFKWLFYGLPVVLLAGLLGLLVLLVALFRGTGPKTPAAVSVVASALFVGVVLAIAGPGLAAPPIHDISTDLVDPPAFARLTLREDNLVGVQTMDNWRTIHAGSYPDIAPVTIDKSVAEVIADANRLARARGWAVAVADPAAGRLEATAQESYFRFNDDVVLRVRPNAGGGSVVDMRSVSRVGVGDLGVNARRVRSFLADLRKA